MIKWAILGTSFISEVMANAIQASQTSQLIAIGSRSMTTAEGFAAKFSIPKIYTNYENLLNDNDIDAVYIGLPNHLHKEWIIRCALAGKHILCEKPFVLSKNEAQEVIAVIKRTKVFCMEALMYRYHPFTSKIQEIIQSKMLGDIKLYNATYTAQIADVANTTAGGSIRNLGCYPISLIRLLAAAEPIEINGSGRFNQTTNTDNQASVILKFPDQSLAVVSTADDIKMDWRFDVHGSKGCLKIISNPWLPNQDNNVMQLYLNNAAPVEIKVNAEKSLYTYQIEVVNKHITSFGLDNFNALTLLDSLGNTIVLENWLEQIKNVEPSLNDA